MGRGNTKQEILEASLELFSVQGYEATSISQIANAVGIRKASLYSHFDNKQAILDALVKEVLEQYAEHSVFACAEREENRDAEEKPPLTPDSAVHMILGQIRYILHDQSICRSLFCGGFPSCAAHGAGLFLYGFGKDGGHSAGYHA